MGSNEMVGFAIQQSRQHGELGSIPLQTIAKVKEESW
jgi:hypothetical protein